MANGKKTPVMSVYRTENNTGAFLWVVNLSVLCTPSFSHQKLTSRLFATLVRSTCKMTGVEQRSNEEHWTIYSAECWFRRLFPKHHLPRVSLLHPQCLHLLPFRSVANVFTTFTMRPYRKLLRCWDLYISYCYRVVTLNILHNVFTMMLILPCF